MLKALLILLRQTALHTFDDHLQRVVSRLPALQRLYVHLQPSSDGGQDEESHLSLIRLLPKLYEKALALKPTLDVRLILSADRVKSLSSGEEAQQMLIFKEGADSKLHKANAQHADIAVNAQREAIGSRKYKHVVLGGTFDRLHFGHYVMLSQASLLAREKITVGVTDGKMNQKKHLWELIRSVEERSRNVREFVSDVAGPQLQCDTVPIYDPFGPAIVYEDIQCIVVSRETERGGEAVNAERLKRGLRALDIFVIDVLSPPEGEGDALLNETKLSSSSRRREALGTLLKPTNRPSQQSKMRPFLIGLTGGIASGKSRLSAHIKERLGESVVSVINTDKLGHLVQEESVEVKQKIREEFGSEVVIDDGGGKTHVDRKALGKIVFGDKSKLLALSRIMWPAIERKVNELISECTTPVLLIEVPALVESGWAPRFHQVWCTFLPREKATERLTSRDACSRVEAESKVDSQISNKERIDHAHVAFCTQWSIEETNRQLEKALAMLREQGVIGSEMVE